MDCKCFPDVRSSDNVGYSIPCDIGPLLKRERGRNRYSRDQTRMEFGGGAGGGGGGGSGIARNLIKEVLQGA